MKAHSNFKTKVDTWKREMASLHQQCILVQTGTSQTHGSACNMTPYSHRIFLQSIMLKWVPLPFSQADAQVIVGVLGK